MYTKIIQHERKEQKIFDKFVVDSSTVADAEWYGAVFAGGEDHGTAHISVVGPGGETAVSATSTINL